MAYGCDNQVDRYSFLFFFFFLIEKLLQLLRTFERLVNAIWKHTVKSPVTSHYWNMITSKIRQAGGFLYQGISLSGYFLERWKLLLSGVHGIIPACRKLTFPFQGVGFSFEIACHWLKGKKGPSEWLKWKIMLRVFNWWGCSVAGQRELAKQIKLPRRNRLVFSMVFRQRQTGFFFQLVAVSRCV